MATKIHTKRVKERVQEKRNRFIEKYQKFDKWLYSIGFRSATFKENSTYLDYNYHTDIDTMYAVECYIHDTLKLSIRFIRENKRHIFYVTGGAPYERSVGIKLVDFQKDIFRQVTELKRKKIQELNKIPTLLLI
jgi:DNA relaxase NicK